MQGQGWCYSVIINVAFVPLIEKYSNTVREIIQINNTKSVIDFALLSSFIY